MAITRLERKGRKNKNVAKNRVATMKRLNATPAVKNIDIDAIKEEFIKQSQKNLAAKKKIDKTEKKVEEAPKEKTKKAATKTTPNAKKETKPKKENKKENLKDKAENKE